MTAFPNKFDWVRAVSATNSGLTSTQHHVALALAEKMNLQGKCFVTHAQLAADTRMSERTICSALTALADMEWIERTPGAVGRATSYRIARPATWTPPSETAARPSRRPRRVGSADEVEAARRYLARIYTETGLDARRVDDDTATARRLLGVLRRHLTHLNTDGITDKVRTVLVETPLTTATDPAAVLLNRYKKALRKYPEHSPKRNEPDNTVVDDVINRVAAAISAQRSDQMRS